MSHTAASAPTIDEVILQAMRKPEDRFFFLQYEAQMVDFVHDSSRHSLDLPPMNTYQRLLVRRCADQFEVHHYLDRLSQVVTLSKSIDSFMPSMLLSDRAKLLLGEDCSTASSSASTPPAHTAVANFKIMRRDPSRGKARSSRDNSDSETFTSNSRKDMTIQEREASYKAARARIFGNAEESDVVKDRASPCASTSSLDVAPNHVRRDMDDDIDFSRAMPHHMPLSANMLPPGQILSSHSHPNLRARAPAFHPPGYGAVPPVYRSVYESNNRSSPSIQQQHMSGVHAWAHQTASYTQQQQVKTDRSSASMRSPISTAGSPLSGRETGSPAPSSSSSRQSSRNTQKMQAVSTSHPSLPAKPTWLHSSKDPSASSNPVSPSAASSTSPLPCPSLTLYNSNHVPRASD